MMKTFLPRILSLLAFLLVFAGMQGQEKQLYSTNFSDWESLKASKSETVVHQGTKYSHETLDFTLYDTAVDPAGVNSKFNDGNPLGWLQAAKSDDPYIITSPLASVTHVRYIHGATGSNRGWKLWAKGDGDADWVVISETVANPAAWCEVDATVNRTNVQLKWTNLTASQNAYMFELDIYGNVDMSSKPTLDRFTVNGKTYEAGEIFDEHSDGSMIACIETSKSEPAISKDNPLTDIVAATGTVGEVVYDAWENMSDYPAYVRVTIPVSTADATINYYVYINYKRDFTLTYYDTDGSILGTQAVEKDAQIGAFAYGKDDVTLASDYLFRGWFQKAKGGNNRKYTVNDVITGDTPLYGIATEEEYCSETARYTYTLTDPYFYPEDHEAFQFTGKGGYHDNQHGWQMKSGDRIDLLVGGRAYIMLYLCRQGGSGVLTLQDSEGRTIQTVNVPVSVDGQCTAILYEGEAGTLSLNMTEGSAYIHKIAISNVEAKPVEKNEQGFFVVRAGDVDHFLTTLDIANAISSPSNRTCIFVPDGLYDLGETVLTTISGSNISIIGQSMLKTIIRNAPPKENEGIGTTATLLITGKGTYLQDLTLQNALDYYGAGSAGRAVCIQDKGGQTICKNVRLLSYQDTYYSNTSSQFYWETSEIHGTVDFICGSGDILFNQCLLVGESRSRNGKSGEATLTAPNPGSSEKYGYVFKDCTIENKASSFNFGRSWGGESKLAYINTTLNQPDEISSSRFTTSGMNTAAYRFKEYHSMDKDGNNVTPASNILSFTLNNKEVYKYETVMTAEEASEYTVENIFGEWRPDEKARQLPPVEGITQVEYQGVAIIHPYYLAWNPVEGAVAYAIFFNDELIGMTDGTKLDVDMEYVGEGAPFSIRAINSMGGMSVDSYYPAYDRIEATSAMPESVHEEYFTLDGMKVTTPKHGVYIRKTMIGHGQHKAEKVVL